VNAMALTIVKDKGPVPQGGGLKMVIWKVTDSNGGGGSLAVGDFFSHITNVHVQNMVSATWISGIWTEDSETITIGAEGASSNVYKVTVWGF